MTLIDLHEMFTTETRCIELLQRLRWPHGPECPRCHTKATRLETKKRLFWCPGCSHQFTVFAGTVFNDTHLSLEKWFLATYLICESRKGMSANQLKRMLGVSYKTAWYLCHRIRHAMTEVNTPDLDGVVEIDETFVGGKLRIGRPHRKKEIVVGVRQRDGELRFTRVGDVKAKTLYKVIHQNVSDDVEFIITDDYPAYDGAMGSQFKDKHITINHSQKQYS